MSRRRVRILSIDGGGIGGVVPARVLARLEAARPGVVEAADLIAGTSVGGILAIALAAGYSPLDCVDLLRIRAARIFGADMLRTIGGGLWRARYDPRGLRTVLGDLLGDAELGDLRPVLIPVVALRRPDRRGLSAKFFATWRSTDSDRIFSAAAIAEATAAAPTYFPAARPAAGWLCWDGGLSGHNSPHIPAAAEVRRDDPDAEIVCLSLGCGEESVHIEAGDWGALQAVAGVIRSMMAGTVGAADVIARQAIGDRFCRINPTVGSYALDDVAAMPRLDRIAADASLEEALSWLDRWWV